MCKLKFGVNVRCAVYDCKGVVCLAVDDDVVNEVLILDSPVKWSLG